MSGTHTKGGAGQMQRLREADAKTHMVVTLGDVVRYLYKDTTGWYVLGYPERADDRHYLTVDADGFFDGVTV